jgi:hypothetical protein
LSREPENADVQDGGNAALTVTLNGATATTTSRAWLPCAPADPPPREKLGNDPPPSVQEVKFTAANER